MDPKTPFHLKSTSSNYNLHTLHCIYLPLQTGLKPPWAVIKDSLKKDFKTYTTQVHVTGHYVRRNISNFETTFDRRPAHILDLGQVTFKYQLSKKS